MTAARRAGRRGPQVGSREQSGAKRAREQAAAELQSAQAAVVPARDRVLGQLESLLSEARFREDEWARKRKDELAELDVEKARLGVGVRDELSDVALKKLQDRIELRQLRIARAFADRRSCHGSTENGCRVC